MGALARQFAERVRAEERRDERFNVRLLGRFMRSDRKEFERSEWRQAQPPANVFIFFSLLAEHREQ